VEGVVLVLIVAVVAAFVVALAVLTK